jgi:MoaA/NifB/PqqE/SkfB family radical SAM enzyme
VEGFQATGKTWLLHLTGGEPSLYPDFVGLCEQLAKHHYLSINSNLSRASIVDFAERINPERVHYINAAVHSDERQKHTSQEIFIRHVQTLQKRQFNVLVSTVMNPAMVRQFPNLSEYFESHGLILLPKAMRGKYMGKEYPDSYTADERKLILEYLAAATKKYSPVIKKMGEAPTIDMFADSRFLERIPDYRGKLCGSGFNLVTLGPNGTIFRCGSGKVLGNLLVKKVKLLRRPAVCDTSYCPYFCEKYTSPKFAAMEVVPDTSFSQSLSSMARRFFVN